MTSRHDNRNLRLTDAEDLCSAARANTLSSWTPVLHNYRFRILDYNRLSVLHAIRLHVNLHVCKIICRGYHKADCLSRGTLENSSSYFCEANLTCPTFHGVWLLFKVTWNGNPMQVRKVIQMLPWPYSHIHSPCLFLWARNRLWGTWWGSQHGRCQFNQRFTLLLACWPPLLSGLQST